VILHGDARLLEWTGGNWRPESGSRPNFSQRQWRCNLSGRWQFFQKVQLPSCYPVYVQIVRFGKNIKRFICLMVRG